MATSYTMAWPSSKTRQTTAPTEIRRQRGAALIAVLWIGVLAALMLIGVRQSASVNLAVTHNDLAVVQARWLARAGVSEAMAILADDATDVDSPVDLWYRDDADLGNVDLGVGTYSVIAPPGDTDAPTAPRYGVVDLAGRLNVNAATLAQFEALSTEGLPEMNPDVAASLLDWRDADQNTRTGGAESAYYEQLPFGYEARNAHFETLDELRLVKGVDDALFFGEDANRNGVLDVNENDGDLNDPADNADGKLDPGLVDVATAFGYELNQTALGEQRINMNTASASDLQNQLGFTSELARGVVQQRGQQQFKSLMDLLKVQPVQNSGRGRNSGGSSRSNSGSSSNNRGGNGGGGNNGGGRQSSASASSGSSSNANNSAGGSNQQVSRITLDWLAENLDRLTLSDKEKLPALINVNTASKPVLMTLTGMTEDAAQRIISYRDSNGGPFDTVGALRSSGAVNDELFEQIADQVTVRSNVFRIMSTGTATNGVRRQLTVVVDRHAVPMQILYWHESE